MFAGSSDISGSDGQMDGEQHVRGDLGTLDLASVAASDIVTPLCFMAAGLQSISQWSRSALCWTGNRISFYIWCPRGESRVKQPDCYRVTAASATSKSDHVNTKMSGDMMTTCDVFGVCLMYLIFIIIKYLSQQEGRSMSVRLLYNVYIQIV